MQCSYRASLVLLGLVAVALLVQPGMSAPAKVHKVAWIQRATPYPNVVACKNNKDKVVFSWKNDVHNIIEVPGKTPAADVCKTKGKVLLPVKVKADYTLDISKLALGTYRYICNVGRHCTVGKMSMVVVVKNC